MKIEDAKPRVLASSEMYQAASRRTQDRRVAALGGVQPIRKGEGDEDFTIKTIGGYCRLFDPVRDKRFS
jgi:hypothetical protein